MEEVLGPIQSHRLIPNLISINSSAMLRLVVLNSYGRPSAEFDLEKSKKRSTKNADWIWRLTYPVTFRDLPNIYEQVNSGNRLLRGEGQIYIV